MQTVTFPVKEPEIEILGAKPQKFQVLKKTQQYVKTFFFLCFLAYSLPSNYFNALVSIIYLKLKNSYLAAVLFEHD